jgi:hypothetical protein
VGPRSCTRSLARTTSFSHGEMVRATKRKRYVNASSEALWPLSMYTDRAGRYTLLPRTSLGLVELATHSLITTHQQPSVEGAARQDPSAGWRTVSGPWTELRNCCGGCRSCSQRRQRRRRRPVEHRQYLQAVPRREDATRSSTSTTSTHEELETTKRTTPRLIALRHNIFEPTHQHNKRDHQNSVTHNLNHKTCSELRKQHPGAGGLPHTAPCRWWLWKRVPAMQNGEK